MAYGKNLPEWYVNRKPVTPMSDAELAEQDRQFDEHQAFWDNAKANAFFSDTKNEQGFPAFYFIAGDVFEFDSAGATMVSYAKQSDPFCKRVFTADMVPVDVGASLIAAAERGDFDSDKFN